MIVGHEEIELDVQRAEDLGSVPHSDPCKPWRRSQNGA